MELERKAYGPGSSKEEIRLLKSRVKELAHDIIYFKEVYIISPFQLDICYEEVKRLSENKDQFFMIVDVSESQRADAECRVKITEWYKEIGEKIKFLIMISGTNEMMILVNKVVLAGMVSIPHTNCRTLEEALRAIEAIKDDSLSRE